MRKILIVGLFCIIVCCLSACGTCNENIAVSGISFNENSLELCVGDEYKLEYTIFPEDATNTNVSFSSSDRSILTVSEDGTVCAIMQGEVSVIVVTEDGDYFDICYIVVEEENQNSGQTDSEEKSDGQTDSQNQEGEDNQDEDNSENQNDNSDEDDQDDEGGEQEDNNDEEVPGVVTYSVTFIADGEVVAVCKFTEENIAIDEPEVPSKTGYTGKWSGYTLSLKNITVYAVYTPIEYTATFKINGFICKTITFTIEDTEIEEPEVEPMAGYTGEWENYVLECRDITINAVYTLIEYTITYDNIKGAENLNSDTYSAENRFVLKDLSLTGYTFGGWYLNGERVYSLNNLYGDLTLTAQWSLIVYTIIFADENANDVIDIVQYTFEDTELKIPDVPEKGGYIGTWTYFELDNDETTIYVYAVYTQIE